MNLQKCQKSQICIEILVFNKVESTHHKRNASNRAKSAHMTKQNGHIVHNMDHIMTVVSLPYEITSLIRWHLKYIATSALFSMLMYIYNNTFQFVFDILKLTLSEPVMKFRWASQCGISDDSFPNNNSTIFEQINPYQT